jgi:hypothetical protein
MNFGHLNILVFIKDIAHFKIFFFMYSVYLKNFVFMNFEHFKIHISMNFSAF